MNRLFLVHGYATGVTHPWLRPTIGSTLGFRAFRPFLLAGTAYAFPWYLPRVWTTGQFLSPTAHLSLLAEERRRAADPVWQEALIEAMERFGATTVVAHSLGVRFLMDAIAHAGLPESVTRIICILPESEPETSRLHPSIMRRLEEGTLLIEKWWCPWDHHLLALALAERRIPAGLLPPRDRWVRSRWFPLWRPWNLHTHPLRSRRVAFGLQKRRPKMESGAR